MHVNYAIKPGDVINDWTIISIDKQAASGHIYQLTAQCKCGAIGHPQPYKMLSGQSISCRDCGRKRGAANNTKYRVVDGNAAASRRLRTCVENVFNRTNTQRKYSKSWKNYTERGIGVYEAWKDDRVALYEYLLTLPGWDDPDLSLDRIDNDGDYEPGNLRFTTGSVQALNRSRNVSCPQCHCQLSIRNFSLLPLPSIPSDQVEYRAYLDALCPSY